MNKMLLFGLSITAVLFSSYAIRKINPAKDPVPITLKVRQVAGNLQAPTAMAFPGNGDIWVTEQTGKIRLIRNGKLSPAAVLDLQSKLPKMNNSYEERGLLGIALHPKFSTNKKFYVFYSTPSSGKFNHTDVVAEYRFASADKAEPTVAGSSLQPINLMETTMVAACSLVRTVFYTFLLEMAADREISMEKLVMDKI